MKRIALNIFLLFAAFILETSVFPLIAPAAAVPNLVLILTFSFGFIYGRSAGMLYGILAGLFMDLFYSVPLGFYTLLFANIGFWNGTFAKYYYADYVILPMLLGLVNEFIYNAYICFFSFILRGRLGFLYYAGEIFVPGMICTLVVTLFIYRFFLRTARIFGET